MHADEGQDAAVGGGAGQDGQHGEEQQVGERVAATLTATRVGDPFQGGEQAGERYHGGSSAAVGPRQRRTRRRDPSVPDAGPHERLMPSTEQPW